MSQPAQPSISVVVCSLNGSRTLRACLEALEHQTIRAETQVVVVDDGSSDTTAEIARTYDVDLIVHERNLGISAARNTGVAAARAPIVAFTDDDCIPDRRWLESLLSVHGRQGVVGVGGPVDVASVRTLVHAYLAEHPPIAPLELELERHRNLPGRVLLYLRSMWAPTRPSGERAVYSFPGANMSFKRDALVAVGMFDPEMTFGSDDEHICAKLRAATSSSSALSFAPDALVHHDYQGTLGDLLRRNYAYGRGHARVYRRDPDQRWPIVFPLPALALALALAAPRRKKVLALLLSVQITFPQGVRAALVYRRLAWLSFSWLRLAEEAAHNAGMLAGLLEHRPARSSARPSKG